jgi:transcriptional regulator with XRE-family HTH domain
MTDGPVERCYAIVGRNIRRERKAQGFTQADLALLLRCARNTVARVEMGHERIMLHTIPKIARWLRCHPSKLTKGLWG